MNWSVEREPPFPPPRKKICSSEPTVKTDAQHNLSQGFSCQPVPNHVRNSARVRTAWSLQPNPGPWPLPTRCRITQAFVLFSTHCADVHSAAERRQQQRQEYAPAEADSSALNGRKRRPSVARFTLDAPCVPLRPWTIGSFGKQPATQTLLLTISTCQKFALVLPGLRAVLLNLPNESVIHTGCSC